MPRPKEIPTHPTVSETSDGGPGLNRLFNHLAAFYYAAREGSIQGGARKLGLNRNSLSRYLEELESVTGGTRLRNPDSESRALELTEAGRHLQTLLAPIFSRLESVSIQWAGGLQELRLGCQSSTSCYLLPGWIRAFEEELMRTQGREFVLPHFSLKTGSSEAVLSALNGLEVDLGIIATDVQNARIEKEIAYTPLFREKLQAICPRAHPYAREKGVTARDFIRNPQYLYYRGGEPYQERINALAPGEGAVRQMEFDAIQAIKETVRAGLGISIIPGGAIRREDMEWLAVVRLDIPDHLAPKLTRVIAAVTREKAELTPLARAFLDYLREYRQGLTESY